MPWGGWKFGILLGILGGVGAYILYRRGWWVNIYAWRWGASIEIERVLPVHPHLAMYELRQMSEIEITLSLWWNDATPSESLWFPRHFWNYYESLIAPILRRRSYRSHVHETNSIEVRCVSLSRLWDKTNLDPTIQTHLRYFYGLREFVEEVFTRVLRDGARHYTYNDYTLLGLMIKHRIWHVVFWSNQAVSFVYLDRPYAMHSCLLNDDVFTTPPPKGGHEYPVLAASLKHTQFKLTC